MLVCGGIPNALFEMRQLPWVRATCRLMDSSVRHLFLGRSPLSLAGAPAAG